MDDSSEHEQRSARGEGVPAGQSGNLESGGAGRQGSVELAVRTLANPSPLGIVVTRGESLVIRYVNPAFRSLVGRDGDLMLGRSFLDVVPVSRGRHIATLLRRVYRTGSALCDIEMRLDGKEAAAGSSARWSVAGRLWRLTVWQLPEESDLPKGLVLGVRDVWGTMGGGRHHPESFAEMREINRRLFVASLRELELMEKAEAANEAKSAFLATMSHELRTPLASILGYVELLAEGLSGPVSELQMRHLARVKLSAEHLLSLIDGVLTIARIDADREAVRREPVAVDLLLDEVATLILPLATSKKLGFRVWGPDSTFAIDTDHTKLLQILVNLTGNAVKFTDRGHVALRARAEEDDAIFTVQDTGVGISHEQLTHIFDLFWQAGQFGTGSTGGSGLGLNVSRRLARLLGGDLTVESTVGVGSEFVLRLPLHAG